jgi:hypothetical protein
MDFPLGETWIEINIPARKSPDRDLLRDVVEPLVHAELVDELETWHFFWEPELRLRLRWRDPSRRDAVETHLATILDRWRDEGRFESWSAGNHGIAGERHRGEAAEYGPEMWDLIQKEWENGSEIALRLVAVGLTGTLTPTAEKHWDRHVHLYTNRIFGFPPQEPWAAEITLCLNQAWGYLHHAISELPKYSGYETLTQKYTRMENHAKEALRVWQSQGGREAE